ncbi:MAG: hypothetical protein ACPG6R_10905 [Aequoribacter sp.]|uniref:hypothetical protein n=1 Tax=Aequoribacter sp. TaxID=2847771 RepID=UPI003C5EC3A5
MAKGVGVMDRIRETRSVLVEVHDERRRQDEKWGEQNHPIVEPSGDAGLYLSYLVSGLSGGELMSDAAKRECEKMTADGSLAWADILLEEVCELLDETDPVKRRYEMIQAAAVLVAMIESEDRRMATEGES